MSVFDPFGDYETKGYLRNHIAEKNIEVVKLIEANSFAGNVHDALGMLMSKNRITFDDVKAVHKQLFQEVYPWAGQDRSENAALLHITKAGIGFQFAAYVGQGTNFLLDQAADPKTMREKPGDILGNLAYAHPFLDGNGRTIMTIHADLCRRANFHIDWSQTNKTDYLTALTNEINDPGKGHLDQYLSPYIREGALSLADNKAQLLYIPGLNREKGQKAGKMSKDELISELQKRQKELSLTDKQISGIAKQAEKIANERMKKAASRDRDLER